MKPSWDDAPEWAQWLAMDRDGEWWWYEFEPVPRVRSFGDIFGRCEFACRDNDSWKDSMEQRQKT